MSTLLDFYRGWAADSAGRMLSEIWSWSDNQLEHVHDFIQWLFPLPEPSGFNPDAPLLTDSDIAAFREDPALRERLHRSFLRMLAFLGLTLAPDGMVQDAANLAERARDVWKVANHNWLRLSRILRSLSLLGLSDEARALYERLAEFHRTRRFPIDDVTFRYWTDAVEGRRPGRR